MRRGPREFALGRTRCPNRSRARRERTLHFAPTLSLGPMFSCGHLRVPQSRFLVGCVWVCVGMKTNPQYRSGGLSDRPGVPTERLSRHISIGIDSSDTKGYYRSVLKWSSYVVCRLLLNITLRLPVPTDVSVLNIVAAQ